MKKNKTTSLLLITALLVTTTTLQAQVVIAKNLQKYVQPNNLPSNLHVPKNITIKNIDLAATAINFSVISLTNQYNGVVKIEGVVKNVGSLPYTSAPNQQVATLYEESGGKYKLVAMQAFQNLASGAEVKVSFTRTWYSGNEFPPVYHLFISYDPDIYIDGNINNDDSNSANNKISRPGSEIRLH